MYTIIIIIIIITISRLLLGGSDCFFFYKSFILCEGKKKQSSPPPFAAKKCSRDKNCFLESTKWLNMNIYKHNLFPRLWRAREKGCHAKDAVLNLDC